MNNDKRIPRRKPTRLKKFDYDTAGAYFVTICTEGRRKSLSKIVGDDVLGVPNNVELLSYGRIVEKYINQLNDFYSDITVDQYVIMPNHIHIILFVSESGTPRTSSPTLRQTSRVPNFVSTLKRFCNREYGRNIWQRGYYDHIIRNYKDYEEHVKYIYENPIRWYFDELYTE
jgi:REP element-mobilizing transposase RayT